MTVAEMHTAVVTAYREAIDDTAFENYKIVPIDRETEDIVRGQFETEYDASYSREIGMRVTRLNEDLYYYASDAKKWKVECNNVQEYLELRLLKGIDELSIDDLSFESAGGILHLSFTIEYYEVVDFDGRDEDAEYMDEIDTDLNIETQ